MLWEPLDMGMERNQELYKTKLHNRTCLHSEHKNVHKVQQSTASQSSTMIVKEAEDIFNDYLNKCGVNTTYRMFNVRQFRESLRIPTSIWHQLEPITQEKINKIRQEIRARRTQTIAKSTTQDCVNNLHQTLEKKVFPKPRISFQINIQHERSQVKG